MSIDLTALENRSTTRVLFTIPLRPLQGDRFQPTGFPGLGAATYQASTGSKLLVESTQSMANRMEACCWDHAASQPISALGGVSHVTVNWRGGKFLTDTMVEAHRLNSPYVLEGSRSVSFVKELKAALGGLETGPVDRRKLAEVLLDYDVGSLIHGVFLAKKELAGGRLRVTRALSAFIDATDVRVAPSGGVKNDHVNPRGVTKDGFGNVPFARDEYTAGRIDLQVNLDLAQIRGYGLGVEAERLLTLLALHRIRRLLDGDLRLRTACDLEPVDGSELSAARPRGFALPGLAELEAALREAIGSCRSRMTHRVVDFEDELRAGRDSEDGHSDASADQDEAEGDG